VLDDGVAEFRWRESPPPDSSPRFPRPWPLVCWAG